MMMIEKESDIMFVKDVAILDIKPQSPTAVMITKVMPLLALAQSLLPPPLSPHPVARVS
jgi:hypothetical protein